MGKIRALIVSRHAFFRQALKTYLQGMDDIEAVAEAGDCTAGLKVEETFTPHLLIVDATSHGLDSLHESFRIKGHDPERRLIFYSMHDPAFYRRRIGRWADACLLQEALFESLPRVIDALQSRNGRDAREEGNDPSTEHLQRRRI